MTVISTHTCIGYQHIKNNKPCQDYSLSYKDYERSIIAVADGHGGNAYIRSQFGAEFACKSALKVLQSIDIKDVKKYKEKDLANRIKLSILCEWNGYVKNHFEKHHFNKKELSCLSDEEKDKLKNNYTKAYGSTLSCAMVIGKYYIFVSLGDTEIFGIKGKKYESIFDSEDNPVANYTYSLCQDDVFGYIKIKVCSSKSYNLLLICSDGLSSPFQDYETFNLCFLERIRKVFKKNLNDCVIQEYADDLALRSGAGDDVSYGIIYHV